MSTFKKWLLIIILIIALVHAIVGGFVDLINNGFTAAHGWNEALIYMLLAIVIAIAVK